MKTPSPNPDHDREGALLNAALELAASERAAFLDLACAHNLALRERLENLLKAHDQAGTFLGKPVFPGDGAPSSPAGDNGPGGSAILATVSEAPGTVIGRYKLLEKIGEGGMGVVYMAEQEEPVRRRVALKIIKLGMDTKQVVARFEAERQALALMDHPHIAKVLDGGATDAGRPYFVMELVRGVPITEFCDKNRLPAQERIKLFITVCQAIQSAHQKGIIHRDLKPTNILVTLNAGVPHPMVIDFGVAKATNQKLTEKTVFTNYAAMIGTPAYMSPEQAEMSRLDVDTRSDIYGLGVLLYELLTGTTPFPEKQLRSAGYREMQRIILEEEPDRPSTRLSTLQGEQRSVAARNRGASELALGRVCPGDLDWIVMKCLEKDRARRYETANGLAMDLQRQLNDEPVVARPPSGAYRVRKFVHRNRVMVTAAAAVGAVLVAGSFVSTWEAIRATRAEREQSRLRATAQREAAKSDQVAQVLKDMLKGIGPGVARGRDTRLLREILDQTAQRLDRELKDQPAVAADLEETLSVAYLESGDYTNALALSRKGLALRETLYGKEHPDVATSLFGVGEALHQLGREAEAETYSREALAMRLKLLGPTNLAVAQSLRGLGWLLLAQNRDAEAETNLTLALALRKNLPGGEDLDFVDSLTVLGDALGRQRRFPEAEAALRRALAIHAKLHAEEYPAVVQILDALGRILSAQGEPKEAEVAFRRSLEIARAAVEPGHPSLRYRLGSLAWLLTEQGRFVEAEAPFREALAITRKVRAEFHPELEYVYMGLDRVLRAQGKWTEAEALCRERLVNAKQIAGVGDQDLATGLNDLARLLEDEGKFSEAETACRESLTNQCQWLRQGDTNVIPSLSYPLTYLAGALQRRGISASTDPVFREALDLVSHSHIAPRQAAALRNEMAWSLATGEDVPGQDAAVAVELAQAAVSATTRQDPNILDTLAAAYAATGQFTKAVGIQREAMSLPNTESDQPAYADRIKLYQSNCHYREAGPLHERTAALLAAGKYAEAEPLARACLASDEKQLPDTWWAFNTRSMLGASLLGQQKYEAAEPLLISAYEGMKQRARQISVNGKRYLLPESVQRLVRLYEETNRPGQAAEWKKRLAELETDKK